MSTYHDYVIKEGVFIGKFNEMYSAFDDPWRQSEQPNRYSRLAGIEHIKRFGIKSVLECGCGLGFYTNWIHSQTQARIKGIDLSPIAIKKARLNFPNLDFEVGDVRHELQRLKDYDCVLFAEIIWYILPNLKDILGVLAKHFQGKYFLVNQVFYKGTQKYGTEYFTNLREFISYVPFQVVAQCEATTKGESTIETSTLFKLGYE